MNNQPRTKPNFDTFGKLYVHSIFKTMQGEGPFAGTPAVFIRLAGCNLQCPRCDTDYTAGNIKHMEPEHITTVVKSLCGPAKLVVITGGEPFAQNIIPLLVFLSIDGFKLQVETNGTVFYKDNEHNDTDLEYIFKRTSVVCSPKVGIINKRLQKYVSCLKYIVSIRHPVLSLNGLPAAVLGNDAMLSQHQHLHVPAYLQPEYSNNLAEWRDNIILASALCLEYGHILSLQQHKLLELP